MIWISTLCLLAIAAWLFFNALNERRWVEAHSHDESVASDEGLFASFIPRRDASLLGDQEKVSIHQENTRFARMVTKVQDKSASLGDKFFESKAAAARVGDDAERPRSASEEDTFFGRAVATVSEKTQGMGQKLDAKMRAASQLTQKGENGDLDGEGLFARASRKVASKSDEISSRIANRARNTAQNYSERPLNTEENGFFSKAVSKVSSGMDDFEKKVKSKVSTASSDGSAGDKDLFSRVASKVGNKVTELDEKFVETSKKAVDKIDK